MEEHKCDKCDQQFKSSQGKLGHLRMRHGIDETKVIIAKPTEVLPSVPQTEKIKLLLEQLEEEKIKRKIREINAPFRFEEDIQELQDSVEYLAEEIENSLTSGIKKEYICNQCKKKGFVAVAIKCTYCDKQGWQGWYP